MWRFKYLLIGVLISGVFGAILFLAGRYVVDAATTSFKKDAVAAVQDGFCANDLPPVTQERIVITEGQLTRALERTDAGSSSFNETGLAVDLVPGEIRVVDTNRSDGSSLTFARIRPTIDKGRIELGEPGGFVGIVLPMGTIADEVELQTFNYFTQNNVTPTSIEVTDRELIIEVTPKPGSTIGTSQVNSCPGASTPTPRTGAATPSPRAGAATPSSRGGASTPSPRAGAAAATPRLAAPTPTPLSPSPRVVGPTRTSASAQSTPTTVRVVLGATRPAATATPTAARPTATRAGRLSPTRTPTPSTG